MPPNTPPQQPAAWWRRWLSKLGLVPDREHDRTPRNTFTARFPPQPPTSSTTAPRPRHAAPPPSPSWPEAPTDARPPAASGPPAAALPPDPEPTGHEPAGHEPPEPEPTGHEPAGHEPPFGEAGPRADDLFPVEAGAEPVPSGRFLVEAAVAAARPRIRVRVRIISLLTTQKPSSNPMPGFTSSRCGRDARASCVQMRADRSVSLHEPPW